MHAYGGWPLTRSTPDRCTFGSRDSALYRGDTPRTHSDRFLRAATLAPPFECKRVLRILPVAFFLDSVIQRLYMHSAFFAGVWTLYASNSVTCVLARASCNWVTAVSIRSQFVELGRILAQSMDGISRTRVSSTACFPHTVLR
jgi:hypothetical protein